MIAGDAVKRLGDVRCPLQDDLLGQEGKCAFCPKLPGGAAEHRPPPPDLVPRPAPAKAK